MNKQINNLKSKKLNIMKATNLLGLGLVMCAGMSSISTAYAHEGGYASGGNGNVLRDGNGNCVLATYGNSYPECEPKVIKAMPIPKPIVVIAPQPAPVVIVPVIKPAPKPQYITRTLSLNESSGANFGFDNDSLSRSAQQRLAAFSREVKSSNVNPSNVTVIGHTDSIGSVMYNQKLSERRANSVAGYLATQGINRQIMRVSGRGELQPVASNKSKTGRAKNRRVDIQVSGQRRITIKK